MSLNQSRFEKNDSQFRKSGGGRSGGQQRPFTGGRGRSGGGGGGLGPGPTTTVPPVSTNRSFKKTNNVQVGQSRGYVGTVNTSESNSAIGARSVENGGHGQSVLHVSIAPAPAPAAIPNPADASAQKSSRPLPRAPSSQSSSTISNSTSPSTPAKGDGAKGFSLQFGSISPGFMNGMQVPARTSSAPPNLDEQKRDQARREAPIAVPVVPLPSAPKQEIPKKDVPSTEQPVNQVANTESKAKRDVQAASASPPTQAQKPSALPMAGIPVQVPFHQPQVPLQFSGANPQIPSQGLQSSSRQLPLQMPLQMGNPSQVPQQVFVPGLQHHLMQSQGLIHQGQNMGFNHQLGPQLPHQLGNLGINMSTQFNQQQAGKYGSTRKTVKITHPETHEELRLDDRDGGSSGSRSHHGSHLTNPLGYYPISYTAGPPFFPAQSSLPLTSTPLTSGSQAPRFNYSVSQAPPTMSLANQSASPTFSVSKDGVSLHGPPDSSNSDYVRNVQFKVPPAQSASTSVTVKAAGGPAGEKVIVSNTAEEVEQPKVLNPAAVNTDSSFLQSKSSVGNSEESATVVASVTAETSTSATSSAASTESPRELASPIQVDALKRETVIKSSLVRDIKNQPSNKGNSQESSQVSELSNSIGLQDCDDNSKVVASESTEDKMILSSSGLREGVPEAFQVSPIVTDAPPSDVPAVDLGTECSSRSSESCEPQSVVNKHGNDLSVQEGITRESAVTRGKGGKELFGAVTDKKTDQDGKFKKVGHVEGLTEASVREVESAASCTKVDSETSSFGHGPSTVSDDRNISGLKTSSGKMDEVSCKEYDVPKSSISENESTRVSANLSEANLGHDKEVMENMGPISSSGIVSSSNKTSVEPNKTKNNRGKKKLKEMLQKADALGTSDLYMAYSYKGPEEKNESVIAAEVTSKSEMKDISADTKLEECTRKNKDDESKSDLDDWEDAADISTPKLESSGNGDYGGSLHDEEGATDKKYSRDFLLTFSAQYTDLPEGFEITSDIADALMFVNVNASHGNREYPSPGKIIDRNSGTARHDRRGNGMIDADRWSKLPAGPPSAHDPGIDLAYGSNMVGFHAGPGPNYGVIRNVRAQGFAQHVGGILSGPMHSLGFQGVQRNNTEADRWQRATNFNKGLMPAPPTPLQVMHKAEKKYEVGKISDEEQAKQRRLKGILNKLTPQNFEKLFEQVKEVNIDNAVTLTGVISQIFDKALTEPTFCEMYANFCYHLASELPDLSVDNEKITFRRLLLNKCQEEFERGEREEEEANKADGEGEAKQSEEEREEKRLKARRRMLGNIRLIGELYKKRMLTERIMHGCIQKLLGQYENPDEENIEALCKLMSTIGEMIDHPKAKEHIDAYFDTMVRLSKNMKLSSRVRFMLKDAIDLRMNKWQQRRKVEGPKKIEEVHRDAAQERQGQAGRLTRGPSMNSAMRRGQVLEFGPRGSMLSPPVGQGIGFRGMPQVRGYGAQDGRMDERNAYESRTISVPLPQRISSDEPITLGPQGGLARGMAFRGQPSMSSSPLLETSPSFGDSRRTLGGLSGNSTASVRGAYSSREDQFARHTSERFGAPVAYDQSSNQELNASYMNRETRNPDKKFNRSRPTTPVARAGESPAQHISSEKIWPEERLHDMSIAAIKEYYSAKDEKEVALCIKDLNSPSFHPNVICIWVTDSFERKEMEQNMLAQLLVNLTKPREGTFTPAELIEGFQSVLINLEDTVNDTPRAPEFLGRIFARVILENVIPLKDVGRLIHEGGEEQGRLLEVGLAGEVLGSVLEMIKSEKGENALKEIRASFDLKLEDFRPPEPIISQKLEMFI